MTTAKYKVFFYALVPLIAGLVPAVGQQVKSTESIADFIRVSLDTNRGSQLGVNLKNLYESPMVAYHWRYNCIGQHPTGYGGYADVALQFGMPLSPNKSELTGYVNAGCVGGLDAVLFSDGTALGSEEELAKMLRKRQFARQELMRICGGDPLLPGSNFSIESARQILDQRDKAAPSPFVNGLEESVTQATMRDFVRYILDRFQKEISLDPIIQRKQMRHLVLDIHDWESVLAGKTYPSYSHRFFLDKRDYSR
jgi:hypothetical protein